MLLFAWCVLIIYIMAMVLGNFVQVRKGMKFGPFFFSLAIQSSIMWCLIYLIMLL